MSFDFEAEFNPTIVADVFDLTSRNGLLYHEGKQYGPFDAGCLSPPCEAYSPGSIGHHWTGGRRAYIPKTVEAKESIALVMHTLDVIRGLALPIWWLENPRGVLRKMPFMNKYPRQTITHCRYDHGAMKATDLWGIHGNWQPRPMCHNATKKSQLFEDTEKLPIGTYARAPKGDIVLHFPDGTERLATGIVRVEGPDGKVCHPVAPRGAKTGTQGFATAAERAVIPYELSKDVCLALEAMLAQNTPMGDSIARSIRT